MQSDILDVKHHKYVWHSKLAEDLFWDLPVKDIPIFNIKFFFVNPVMIQGLVVAGLHQESRISVFG